MKHGFEITDPGHVFRLLVLDKPKKKDDLDIDVDHVQQLHFVKREGEGFPGNKGAHEGTTLQCVIRALHSRVAYLHSQHPADENIEVMEHLKQAHYHLEHRAARRHNVDYDVTPSESLDLPMCPGCGHTYIHGHSECVIKHEK